MTATITPLGRRTEFVRRQGRLTERREPGGARVALRVLGRRPDHRGGGPGRRAPRDPVRRHGEAEATVDPFGRVTTTRYDVLGNRTSVVAADDAKWRFAYDELCRLTRITDPTGATWLREYDVGGNLVGRSTRSARAPPRWTTTAASPRCTTGITSASFDFDELGRCLAQIRPDGTSARAGYDRMGRRTTVEDPVGGSSTLEYTPAGRVRRAVEPSGRTTTFEYDRCGRPVARGSTPAGGAWEFRYDADGALVESVVPDGVTERFTYDAPAGSSRDTPGPGLPLYAYDSRGRVAAVTDRGSGTRRFAYDVAGRLVAATRQRRHHALPVRRRAAGWPRSTTRSAGTSTRDYDADGRLVARDRPARPRTTWCLRRGRPARRDASTARAVGASSATTRPAACARSAPRARSP